MEKLLDDLDIDLWGCADLSPMGACAPHGYPKAVVMVASLFRGGPVPELDEYEEADLHNRELEACARLRTAAARFCGLLDERGIDHFYVQGQDQESLSSCFQQKTAATLAGLGWVGRNSLLVTERWGPLVEMATLLVSDGPPAGTPVTRSQCFDCELCVAVCPARAITGGIWYPGCARADLLDAFGCDSWRSSFIGRLGRKHYCAICAVACPAGR